MTITAIYHGGGDDDIVYISSPTSLIHLKIVLLVIEAIN